MSGSVDGGPLVRLWFDFVSPYAWLALERAGAFGEELAEQGYPFRWELRPFLFGAVLTELGRTSPGEIQAQRVYGAHDAARIAARAGLPFVGPPVHPFLPLGALRVALLFAEQQGGLEVSRCLARMCWGEGADLTRDDVLVEAAGRAGVDTGDLVYRSRDRDIKDRLRANTRDAVAAGVFGIPTFEVVGDDGRGELFWGHDRLELLGERLRGELTAPGPEADRWLAQPMGPRLQRPLGRPTE